MPSTSIAAAVIGVIVGAGIALSIPTPSAEVPTEQADQ